MNIQHLALDGVTLTRVGYTDVALPRERLGLGADDFARAPWRSPLWTDDARLLIGPLWPTPGYGRWENGAFVAGNSRADHG